MVQYASDRSLVLQNINKLAGVNTTKEMEYNRVQQVQQREPKWEMTLTEVHQQSL